MTRSNKATAKASAAGPAPAPDHQWFGRPLPWRRAIPGRLIWGPREMRVGRKDGYRSDIDGLRAVAIVSVVGYHAGLPGFSGGFIGVDIFFVLSGFLITGLLKQELETRGRIDLLRFYARRARRLFPNLFLMLLAVALLAPFMLLPNEQNSFGGSLIASGTYTSNIFFWRATNYFAPDAETFPLLHTWSLAVEEQFYIFWPIFIVIAGWLSYLGKSGRLFLYLASAVTVLSLALSLWATQTHSTAAFFLTPTRVWQFSIGGLLAYYLHCFIHLPAIYSNLISFLGAALLLVSIVFLSDTVAYPGVYALLPAIGTFAIILGCSIRPDSYLRGVLSTGPFVWVGLISYSLYLWHWPILVYLRHYSMHELTYGQVTAGIALSVAVAWLAWRFVELPIRLGRHSPLAAPPRVFRYAAVATAVSLVVGIGFWKSQSGLMPGLYSQGVIAAEAAMEDANPFRETCFADSVTRDVPSAETCVSGAQSVVGYQGLLWGDSHADHLMPALSAAGKQGEFRVRQVSKTGCPPLLGVMAYRNGVADHNCRRFTEEIVEEIKTELDGQLQFIVLAADWTYYLPIRPKRFQVTLARPGSKAGGRRESLLAMEQGLSNMLSLLKSEGVMVLVVGKFPEFRTSVPQCLARAHYYGRPVDVCGAERGYIESHRSDAMRVIERAIERNERVRLFDPIDLICDREICMPLRAQKILYLDDDHLSRTGAVMIADALHREIRAIALHREIRAITSDGDRHDRP